MENIVTITLLYLTLLGNIEMTSFEIPSKESCESWFHYNVKVEENKRRRIAELLNGLNYNLQVGNFELNSESGDIRFRASQIFHELNEDSELIFRRQMDLCMHSLDNVIPVIMSVVYAGVLPEQALAQFYNRADSSMN